MSEIQQADSSRVGRVEKGSFMGVKLKVTGWLAVGAVAGALTTMQLQATARRTVAQLPLEERQAARRGVGCQERLLEPFDEKKLISDAMAAWRRPRSALAVFDKKSFKDPLGDQRSLRCIGIGIGMETASSSHMPDQDRRLSRGLKSATSSPNRLPWSRAHGDQPQAHGGDPARVVRRFPQDEAPLPGDDRRERSSC